MTDHQENDHQEKDPREKGHPGKDPRESAGHQGTTMTVGEEGIVVVTKVIEQEKKIWKKGERRGKKGTELVKKMMKKGRIFHSLSFLVNNCYGYYLLAILLFSRNYRYILFSRSSKRKRDDDDMENKENAGENKGGEQDLEAYMKAKRAKVADETLTTRTGM